MKRKPFSALGYHIQIQRENHLFRRRKLAKLIGIADSKLGAAAIRMLEETGTVDQPCDLLVRLTHVLHLNENEVRQLQEQDRLSVSDWLSRISKPIQPYLGLKTGPIACTAKIPDQIIQWGSEAIEDYASEFARSNGIEVHAVLSQRIRLEFNRCGELVEISEAGRGHC